MTTTHDTVKEIAQTVCQPNVPDLENFDKALLDSGLDSLDYASLLMALEDKFDLQFSNEEMESLNTINMIAAVIDARPAG